MTGPVVQINTKAGFYGGEYQVLKLVEGLLGMGCESLLLAHRAGALFARARAARLPVLPLPPVVCEPWCPGGSLFVRRLLARRRPALMHAHDSRALALAPRTIGGRPVPAVLSRRVPSPFRINAFSKGRYSPARLAAIIAVSQAVKDVLVASGVPEWHVRVVASGTDIRQFDAAVPDRSLAARAGGRPVVGGIGELTTKKNWDMLIRVAAETKRRGLDLRWVVAGEGPERTRLERLAAQLGVAGEVRFPGYRADIESFTKGLSILLHTSRAEATAGTGRMAMLAGVPVVAVGTPGVVETIGEYGISVARDDDRAMADAIERLVRDEAFRSHLTARAAAYARAHFGIDAMVAGNLRVYESVLGVPVPRREDAP